MAKELSKVGIITGNDIKAPHVTQSVDAFTGLDAYDITISGSLEVTGSISTDSTVYANALNLEGGNIQYFPSSDTLKFGDNIKLGIGAGVPGFISDLEIASDGTNATIRGFNNLEINSKNTTILNESTVNDGNGMINIKCDNQGDGQPGGFIKIGGGTSTNDRLEVLCNITASANISASGDIFGDNLIAAQNITSSANISASGYIIASSITSSGDILGVTISASNDLYVGDNLTVADNITQQDTDSILTLGSRGDIRVGVNDFLKTDTTSGGLQQINLNPTQNHSSTVTMYAANNKGINLKEKDTSNFVTSSLDITNFSGTSNYGVIDMTWNSTLNHGNILYILNSVTEANGGGVIHFGNAAENFTFSMYGKGSNVLTGGNHGFKLANNAAIQLNSNLSFKPTDNLWNSSSDSRLKSNIITASIDTCYNNVKSLPLKHFKWNSEVMYGEVEDKHVLGWIAQDVKEVLPKAVQSGSFTTWSEFTGSVAIKGSDNKIILEPGERYQDVLAGSKIIEDSLSLQADQITKMMYGAIQKLQEKVEALELQISGSNS